MLRNVLRIVPNRLRLLLDVHTNIQLFTIGTELFSINDLCFNGGLTFKPTRPKGIFYRIQSRGPRGHRARFDCSRWRDSHLTVADGCGRISGCAWLRAHLRLRMAAGASPAAHGCGRIFGCGWLRAHLRLRMAAGASPAAHGCGRIFGCTWFRAHLRLRMVAGASSAAHGCGRIFGCTWLRAHLRLRMAAGASSAAPSKGVLRAPIYTTYTYLLKM